MKKLFLTILLGIILVNLNSQTEAVSKYVRPEFKTGRNDFYKFIQKNTNYPLTERESGNQGFVKAIIYISKEGKIKKVNTIGKDSVFNNIVKKSLLTMPDWNYAKLNGNPIDTFIIQKIYFSVNVARVIKYDTTICEIVTYTVALNSSEEKIKAENYNKGIVLSQKAKKELDNANYISAIETFNQAENYGYTDVSLYYNRAIALIKAGNKDFACLDWSEAIRLGDNDALNAHNKFCK